MITCSAPWSHAFAATETLGSNPGDRALWTLDVYAAAGLHLSVPRNLEGIAFTGILAVVITSVAILGSVVPSPATGRVDASAFTYTDNGLTCPVSVGTTLARVGNVSTVGRVIQLVVQSPQFVSATKGLPYVLGYAGNMTNGSQTSGGITTRLPNRLELGFVTASTETSCVFPSHWIN